MEQAELVGAAQEGDRQAFEELVRRTYVDTFTLACRLTGNQEDAGDVVQDTYLRAWRGIGRFRGEAQFSTWLYRITANAAATHVRKRYRHAAEPFDDLNEPAEEYPDTLPEAAAESGELLERLATAVAALPPKLRALVVLKDVYGLPHDEIAEELGISVAAAKVRLHRARRRLRDMLYDQGEEAHAV
ncbi:MAG: RNA polymerase sigma factor [Acidimicrobiia bacterium]|nr:RNA polymerase sigma factor [Acidimicrobiia bacterium]